MVELNKQIKLILSFYRKRSTMFFLMISVLNILVHNDEFVTINFRATDWLWQRAVILVA